ncbi:hypothetical protein KO465_06040 [Candidatus Micrarchaeota archaeon]|nr:hypothetical protein [Candidatus Micrarchaeota archaeon]
MKIRVSTKIYPLRVIAYTNTSVDVTFFLQNQLNEILWLECDMEIPENLSLSNKSRVTKGRMRIGIMGPRDTIEKPIKIYSTPITYPDVYNIKCNIRVFNRFGAELDSVDHRFNIRCIKSNEMEKQEIASKIQ